MERWSRHSCPVPVLLAIHALLWGNGVYTFLLNGPRVKCPHPATNCLQETFNRVFEHLGCLGCQSGCQPGYIMTANPKYHVTEGDLTGSYDYQNITIPNTRNVSEPEWLCLSGDTCPWGFFSSKIDATDACSYCGEGCRSCQSYDNCDHCVMGYKLTKTKLPNGREASLCVSSGVECPSPPDNCEHKTFVSQIVGCQGCMYCKDGYLPTYNPSYRRPPENQTDMYLYQGIRITGSLEVMEPRYTCYLGSSCPSGWVNVTRGDFLTCEEIRDDTIG
ncbi:hypothetical protein EGW08_002108 [Elysia chlorotica]|uniref:Uncharacterized protein n=1 Tax=Elysia chlorotica TaxID=188477 RepID=A0A3S1I120_ELYCH|nr:hypothetical protein EGW08_002108 [Elysia chlorotica]